MSYNDNRLNGDKKFTVTDFCLLVFIAFERMHILKSFYRKPFCLFLQERAFMSNIPNVKSFNNYANKNEYQELEKYLSISIADPSEDTILLCQAFQKIKQAFQNSDYFHQLRVLRDNMKKFEL